MEVKKILVDPTSALKPPLLHCCNIIFFQAFTASGTNLVLYLGPQHKDKKEAPSKEFVDFDKEQGKVRKRTLRWRLVLYLEVFSI